MNDKYEAVIGLEVHVELATKTKIFCACSTEFGGKPNTHVCPFCMGMPGTLPVLNEKVLEYAVAVGLATNCEISEVSKFDRKNYFYPDNPQNYQISQLYLPICKNGSVEIETENGTKTIGIHEIHMEEDAGKLIHDDDKNTSLVDYNRAGVPLLEIVSEPHMGSSEEVIAYLNCLRTTIGYLGASDCRLNEGSMRVDVNLSVRKAGDTDLGTRTETKNLNSFRAITHVIENEKNRQIAILEAGGVVEMETRRWDERAGSSFSMRSKEDAKDYRYFPDPDLMPIHISAEYIDKIKASQPEFKKAKKIRYKSEYDLPEYDIEIITDSKRMADVFEKTAAICNKPKKVSNWLIGETMRLLKERLLTPDDINFSPENLAALIDLVENKTINTTIAKQIFEKIFENDINPVVYVEECGLKTENDEDSLRELIKKVINENEQSVMDYRKGKDRALGFLVGQTMKESGGKADPNLVSRLLRDMIS